MSSKLRMSLGVRAHIIDYKEIEAALGLVDDVVFGEHLSAGGL